MAHDPYYDLISLPPEPPFDPKRTALLTIDLQYLDAHPSGWMGRLARNQGRPDHRTDHGTNRTTDHQGTAHQGPTDHRNA